MRKRRPRRARRMVGVGERRAPQRHHGIAEELVDIAAGRLDRFDHQRVVAVGQRHQLLGREPGGKRGEAREVGEHHGDLAPLAAQPQLRLALGQLVDDARREIVAERFLNPMPAALFDQQPDDIGQHHRQRRAGDRNGDREPEAERQQSATRARNRERPAQQRPKPRSTGSRRSRAAEPPRLASAAADGPAGRRQRANEISGHHRLHRRGVDKNPGVVRPS